MKSNVIPLIPNNYYHIYNRGINGEVIFKSEQNYHLFLTKYSKYVSPFVDTFAYCLLSNHFHLLVRLKSEEEILEQIQKIYPLKKVEKIERFIIYQFGYFFNGYTQIINKQFNRTGALFESPFRRIEVISDAYFSQLVWYIHHNPQKHGFVQDFREYPHSSYHSHLIDKPTKLKRVQVLNWFGGESRYKKFHHHEQSEKNIKALLIE